MTKRKRSTFTKEFKEQVIKLHAVGNLEMRLLKNTIRHLRLLINGFASIKNLVRLKK